MSHTIDVFISYKREERALAEQVARALEAAGYTQVTDLNLEHGEHFGDAITRMIESARLVLVLWTPSAAGSDWVKDEARLGNKLGTYLGVMVEQADLPVDIQFKHYLDLQGTPLGQSMPTILDAVGAKLGAPRHSVAEASARSAELNRDVTHFEQARNISSIAAWDVFLDRHPDGFLSNLARIAREKLEAENARREAEVRRDREAEAERRRRQRRFGWLPPYQAVFGFAGVVLTALALWIKPDFRQVFGLDAEEPAPAVEASMAAEAPSTEAANPNSEGATGAQPSRRDPNGPAGENSAVASAAARRDVERLIAVPENSAGDPEPANGDFDPSVYRLERDCVTISGLLGYELSDFGCVAANARALDLSYVSVTGADLAKLAQMTALESLSLVNALIDSARPLSSLIELRHLELNGTGISDVAPLAGMSRLQELDLTGTNVSDIGALSGLTDLRYLSLSRTLVRNLTPISEMTELETLYLWRAPVENLTPLSGLTALGKLNISDIDATDLRPLRNLNGLHYLVPPDAPASVGDAARDTPAARREVRAWIEANT